MGGTYLPERQASSGLASPSIQLRQGVRLPLPLQQACHYGRGHLLGAISKASQARGILQLCQQVHQQGVDAICCIHSLPPPHLRCQSVVCSPVQTFLCVFQSPSSILCLYQIACILTVPVDKAFGPTASVSTDSIATASVSAVSVDPVSLVAVPLLIVCVRTVCTMVRRRHKQQSG